MIVSVSQAEAEGQSRVVAIRLASLTLRFMENWRREVGGHEEAMILLAMVAIIAERLLRTTIPDELKDLRKPMPQNDLARCNIASIAEATGINRETVRRKLGKMVEQGNVVRQPDGAYLFSPEFMQQKRVIETIQLQLESLRGLTQCFIEDGIFEIA